jgi:hypothetical protein
VTKAFTGFADDDEHRRRRFVWREVDLSGTE